MPEKPKKIDAQTRNAKQVTNKISEPRNALNIETLKPSKNNQYFHEQENLSDFQ